MSGVLANLHPPTCFLTSFADEFAVFIVVKHIKHGVLCFDFVDISMLFARLPQLLELRQCRVDATFARSTSSGTPRSLRHDGRCTNKQDDATVVDACYKRKIVRV